MNNKKHLNLNIEQAEQHAKDLIEALKDKYKVNIAIDKTIQNGNGHINDNLGGDLSIKIGFEMRSEGYLFKKVNDLDFLKAICALYHEEQHLIQNCKTYKNKYPNEDTISMATRKLVSYDNRRYYKESNRYRNDLSEIEAEITAISNTYDYIKSQFPKANADALICNLVNDKAELTYFIKGHYESFDEILDAFSEHYEDAKQAEVIGYIAYALRPSQNIDPAQDECIKYLQACVRENPDEIELMTKFNSAAKQSERDLMIASITCHLHPEIEYEKVYPCLQCIDLSPENIFDRSLPKPPEGLVEKIPEEDIKRRIEIANSVYKRITANEYSEYLRESEITEHTDLNQALDIRVNDKNKTYEP